MKKKLITLIYLVPFLLFLIAISLGALVTKDQVKSESENRYLQQYPSTFHPLNFELASEMDKYLSDQLPLRDRMVRYYSALSIKQEKDLIHKLYVTEHNYLIQIPPRASREGSNLAIEKLKELTDLIQAKEMDNLFAFTPRKSSGLQEDLLPLFYHGHMEAIDYFEERLSLYSPQTNYYNLSKDWRQAFSIEERRGFYFKTDSHWNGLGAEEALKRLLPQMQHFASFEQGEYQAQAFSYLSGQDKVFLGDFNRQLQFQFPAVDDYGYFEMPDKEVLQTWLYKDSQLNLIAIDDLYANGVNEDKVDYSKIYTLNYGYYKIVNPHALNPTKLVIVKDSYMNAMLPFFVKYFSQIEVLDPRYIQNGDTYRLIEESDADAVLILFNDGVVFGGMYDFKK